jgi:hypothetical protein
MIELRRDSLRISFPEVHPDAKLTIDFQRTLRIPDDGAVHHLPPGLGRFPVRHVDDFAENVPARWMRHGGVMLPMYQSEAMWIYFDADYVEDRETSYPFAVKIAAGKINAVTGEAWEDGLRGPPKRTRRRPRREAAAPREQNYVVAPAQPWLDGYCVEKGIIRQFVAMPLGAGYTAEEQITGEAEHGGLQLAVYPMKREVFEERFPKVPRRPTQEFAEYDMRSCCSSEMGLAPGGRMKQEIYADPYGLGDWDTDNTSRCFVHIANSLVWRSIAGDDPPTTPPTSKEYTEAGLPWFDYYSENGTAVDGAKTLEGLKSVVEMGKDKGDVPLPENESVTPEKVILLRKGLKKAQVREGTF